MWVTTLLLFLNLENKHWFVFSISLSPEKLEIRPNAKVQIFNKSFAFALQIFKHFVVTCCREGGEDAANDLVNK